MNNVPVSQRLLEVAGKDLPPADQEAVYLSVLKFVQTAWNLAILPADSALASATRASLLRMPVEVRRETEAKLAEWISRKQRMFPMDRRIITEVQLRDRKTHVAVVASHVDFKYLPQTPKK